MVGKRTYLWFLLASLALLSSGCLERQMQPSIVISDTYQFTGTVDSRQFPQILLRLLVESSTGTPVTGIRADELLLTENGQPMSLTDFRSLQETPIATVLVIDHSGSMSEESKLTQAKQAAIQFIDLMKPQDKIGIIGFNKNVNVVQGFTQDKRLLKNKINSLKAEGLTALYDATIKAIELTRSVSGEKSVIVLTDGFNYVGDTVSGDELKTPTDVIQAANDVRIFTLGLGTIGKSIDQAALKKMSSATGGKTFITPDATELAKLYGSIARQLRYEYLLEYRSVGGRDGFDRRLEVRIEHEEKVYQIQTRFNPGGVIPIAQKSTATRLSAHSGRFSEPEPIFFLVSATLLGLLLLPLLLKHTFLFGSRLRFNLVFVQPLHTNSPHLGKICPFENSEEFPIRPQIDRKIVVCPKCKAVHHLGCWVANEQSCSTCNYHGEVMKFRNGGR